MRRWLTPDPLGGDITNPQSLNRYAYVGNNPTTLTDPLGLQCDRAKRPCPVYEPPPIGGFPGDVFNFGDEFDILAFVSTPTATVFAYPVAPEGLYNMLNNPTYASALLFPYYGNLSAAGLLGYLDMAEQANARGSGRTPIRTQAADREGCRQQFLMNNGGPGAQALVSNFSLFSYVPASGKLSDVASTPAAKATFQAFAVKGGVFAAGWVLGRLFNLPALQEAAAGAAQFVPQVGAVLTGIATAMDARARYTCGDWPRYGI